MAIPIYTGLGTAITALGGLDVLSRWRFRSVSGVGVSNDLLDDTELEQTSRFLQFVPGALNMAEDQSFEAYWELAEPFPDPGELSTLTWSLPLQEGQTTPGSFNASGYISVAESGAFDPLERTIGTIAFKIDNQAIPPVYVPNS